MTVPIIQTQPLNYNFLSQLGYRFLLKRLPGVVFNMTSFYIPGMSTRAATLPTPFKNIPKTGDKITYEPFTITYKVDEDMNNYNEIKNWLDGMTFPERFQQFQKELDGRLLYSDATLIILNSSMKSNIEFTFEEAFPISLSGITLNTQDSDVSYIEVTSTFEYKYFTVKRA